MAAAVALLRLQIEWFWGKECVEEVAHVRSDLRDGKYESASATISNIVGSMSSVTGKAHILQYAPKRLK